MTGRLKIDPALITDPILYDVLYFSPIEVGDERYSNQMYFETDIYARQWPTSMMEKMTAQVDQLRHVELGIHPFDKAFKRRHREVVMFHCKMAFAYLDSREARISMKLAEAGTQATRTSEQNISRDPEANFDFLRITTLSVLACAARRIKFYQKAMDALSEAKDICLQEGEANQVRVHPLLTAITLLNLSAVLGDVGEHKHGLRWGLEALSLMYSFFAAGSLPDIVQAYLLVLACHNTALLHLKQGNLSDAIDLVNEGIERSKTFQDDHDDLRKKLLVIGAKAKNVPEGFLTEAVNAVNGWGEEKHTWNLSFWDFSSAETCEVIDVLQRTASLQHLIVDCADEEDEASLGLADDDTLLRLVLAVVKCSSLETFTVSGIDFTPRKVWRRLKKPSFLETAWYSATINYALLQEDAPCPEVADYNKLLHGVKSFAKKLAVFLIVLGNECEGIDLAENAIDASSISGLVRALRWPERPEFSKPVSSLELRSNELDADSAAELAGAWSASEGAPPSVTSLDVSCNERIGDEGFAKLVAGVMQFEKFKALQADGIGLGRAGCSLASEILTSASLEFLSLSDNTIGPDGVEAMAKAVQAGCPSLNTLILDNCRVNMPTAAGTLGELVRSHKSLKMLSLGKNSLECAGAIEFCSRAAQSQSMETVNLSYNNIISTEACQAIAEMMTSCTSIQEVHLSGNKFDREGSKHIGRSIEQSPVLRLCLENMGFNHSCIDDFLTHGSAETQDLQVMILSRNPIGDEGFAIISESLSMGLTDLALSNCGLTAASKQTLLQVVSLSPSLKSMDLSSNELGPGGCVEMVSWMQEQSKENFALRYLELSSTGLGDDGFLRLVPVMSSLDHLGVSGNGISSAGLEAVMNSTHMIQLQTLNLANNSIGEQGLHALTERFQEEHKRLVWNPKQLTSAIDTVILTGNPISQSLATSTEVFLRIHNPLLAVVW